MQIAIQSEIAAQLAEANEHLAKIANPMMVVTRSEEEEDREAENALSKVPPPLEKLNDDYRSIVRVLNLIGTRALWLSVRSKLGEIHQEGMKYGCSYDQNPTVRIADESGLELEVCPLCRGTGKHLDFMPKQEIPEEGK